MLRIARSLTPVLPGELGQPGKIRRGAEAQGDHGLPDSALRH